MADDRIRRDQDDLDIDDEFVDDDAGGIAEIPTDLDDEDLDDEDLEDDEEE
jgi:hypothetical protein